MNTSQIGDGFETSRPGLRPAQHLRKILVSTGLILAASQFANAEAHENAATAAPSPTDTASPTQSAPAGPDNAILVGMDADMSKGSAQSGEAIRRGAVLAMDEINAAGGVLGRPLHLVIRNHRGVPARGIDNILELARMDSLVAVIGGAYTPVALAELKAIHKQEVIYLGPWAAGTPIVDNGYDPNFVFRVSVRDELAGGFLVDAARKRGLRRLGLLLWNTGWGRSNRKAMEAALAKAGKTPATVQWINSGQTSMKRELDALVAAGADVVMLVATATESVRIVREMASRPPNMRLPIISHWGITTADFHAKAADAIAKIDLSFLQTYSFFDPPRPAKGKKVYKAYCANFGGCRSPADVISPVGTAHAYDLTHLLAKAIKKAGATDRRAVRRSLETLGRHDGLVRVYDPPFTAKRHDALSAADFRLCRYDANGAIKPVD